jgi:Dullard-like phosphatase family protein
MATKTFATRPFAKNFLKKVSKNWEIIIFTAGLKDYADKILDELDPEGYISRRLYRDSCMVVEGVYIKDLKTIAKDLDLSKTVIVDNMAVNFSLQVPNGIEIKTWNKNDIRDKEMIKLEKVLIGLSQMDDVRIGIKNING